MLATGTPLAGSLPLFRTRQADLLARGEASGHPVDTAVTLGLALSRLAGEAPPAAGRVRRLPVPAPPPGPPDPPPTHQQAARPPRPAGALHGRAALGATRPAEPE